MLVPNGFCKNRESQLISLTRELKLPATSDNHLKYKVALVKTIQELNNLNIRSAMNSGADVLGEFYEVFLKYGNELKKLE